ncbi:hypothetical protein Cgig2_029509 [Carnegiea gigantea]|uniref:Uncharacterized protein n=1 Tax=Carnegiea gigantea TaxID=171969 RepID=A0A9Q1QK18_9CARY|nr:hypothetical protein Cgig2_029509 [Carnegiea gigantea]
MSKLERQKWSESTGVIVRVYEESATVGSNFHQDGNSGEKITRRERKAQPWPCRHDDRRADLLAYARHLRDMASQHLHQNPKPTASLSKPVKKQRKLLAPVRKVRLSFGQPGEAWRCQRIESRVHERKYRSCYPTRTKWSKLSKMLRRLLKEWSTVWKCNNRS